MLTAAFEFSSQIQTKLAKLQFLTPKIQEKKIANNLRIWILVLKINKYGE